MCPQKPNIFDEISCLNPYMSALAQIITVILKAMATIAILIISLEKLLDPEAATFLAMKNSKFMSELRCEDKVIISVYVVILLFVYLIVSLIE